MNKRITVTVFVAFAAVACLVAQPEYDLKLGREFKEFDRYYLKTNYERTSTTTTSVHGNERESSKQSVSVFLAAQCDIASVTVDGQEKEKRLTIRECTAVVDNQNVTLLPSGTIVKCWFSDSGSVFTVNDKPLADSISSILAEVVQGEGGARTGEVFNAKKPVRVGQQWKINVLALRSALGLPRKGAPKQIRGTVTFTSIDSTTYTPSAVINAVAEIPRYKSKVDQIPTEMSVEAEFEVRLPIDNRYPLMSTGTTVTQRVQQKVGALQLDAVVKQKRQSSFDR